MLLRRPRRGGRLLSSRALLGLGVGLLLGLSATWQTSRPEMPLATSESALMVTESSKIPVAMVTPAAESTNQAAAKPLPGSDVSLAKEPPPIPAIIAYCVYPENKAVPPGHTEFMARTYGPHIFPAPKYRLVMRPVLPLPSDLPKGVKPTSTKALDLLGLINAHVRFCPYGSSQLVKLLLETGMYTMAYDTFSQAKERLTAAGLWDHHQSDSDGWTHHGFLHWPNTFSILTNTKDKKAMLPIVFRHSPEPLAESVKGVPVQLDVKRVDISDTSVTMYWPMILDSMAFRWKYGNSSYGQKIGGRFETIKEAVTRPVGFDARKERLAKSYFASSVSQHCAGRRAHYPSVAVRELFTYALASRSRKAVHNIGECPTGDVGATRALLTVERRAELHRQYSSKSVSAIHADHKFAIAFENSGIEGYFTEKVMSAYIAKSVPVYNGPPDFANVLNPKAVINCALPLNLTGYTASMRMKSAVCSTLPTVSAPCSSNDQECIAEHGRRERDQCANAYQAELEKLIWPLLVACADRVLAVDADDALYEAMLAEPLVPVDENGDLKGIWNASSIGRAMRALVVGVAGELLPKKT